MKILITGAAGFVGYQMAKYFKEYYTDATILGIDNLSRRGSEYNVPLLKELGCTFFHGDIRNKEDVDDLPKVDWVIDCAANPSVLAGLEGGSFGLINNNLIGTIYLLEKCKRDNAGFIMLSTSRVYSIDELNRIPLAEKEDCFAIEQNAQYPRGFSEWGVAESFSTSAPISLYGSTKLASEVLALEYHYTFGFPVWIDRCGVIAGPGQFGKIDQGIFSFWIYQYLLGKPLSYIGFGGKGKQARDFFHPRDLFSMIQMQIAEPDKKVSRLMNLGGGVENTYSLAQLDAFCKQQFGNDKVINSITENRSFDIPLYVTDYSLAKKEWGWQPKMTAEGILNEITEYARKNIDLIKKL
ncbi:NAD-dependent epimerase/dehydratase family protein [Mucilaginibacter sp. AW1-3]